MIHYNILCDGKVIHTSYTDHPDVSDTVLLTLVLGNHFWTPESVRQKCIQGVCTLERIQEIKKTVKKSTKGAPV
jgi:hypothetical protein